MFFVVGSTASAKALASAKSAEVPKALQSALAEAVIFLQLFDFKRFLTVKGIILLFMLLYLQYYISDGTLMGFIKQLIEWLIIPLFTNILNNKK
ncbi:hypothetical protein B4U30_02690 [Klebsiella pneumoniae]|nr:hypothetical protein [Klebsiella pneumoniae]PAX29609.1 hypothetical protein CLI88_27400 [Klebsiella pneumoniae]PVW84948.1 hypothetical protein B4U30_02690 [Klebsiella pneumoniae]RLZ95624.1 hypothetical protein EA154_26015 [Enterobacter hormaechei subsp. hoffmannii]HBX4016147.1 hypothetical protein [Klebsiella pneumoniae subsp. pneumoniae]